MNKATTVLLKPTTLAMIVSVVGVTLSGCATVATSPEMLSDASRKYDSRAEAVFMYQSRIASRVLDRSADLEIEGESDLDPTLTAAESRMAEECRYLNEAAVTTAEGQSPGWDLRLQVMTSTNACARIAHEVELLLDNSGDTIATAKL